jgi:hypothetical protein
MTTVHHEHMTLSSGAVYYDGDVYQTFDTFFLKYTSVPHGQGTMQYDNGDVYSGQWKDGEYWGRGKFTTDDYDYDGDWAHGVKRGLGKLTEKSGTYDGWFENDQKSGPGKKTYPSGAVFLGKWNSDKIEGTGTLNYLVGGVWYNGEFNANTERPEGKGTMKYANGDEFDGHFKKGKRDGPGTYLHDGLVAKGTYKMDKKNGWFMYRRGDIIGKRNSRWVW